MAGVPTEETDQVVTDAVDLLTRDHRLVDELFASFAQAAPQQLDPLARRLWKMLRIHTQIEEELFYPATRRALGDGSLIDHAEHDHDEAKRALTRVESMASDNGEFKKAVEELHELVTKHVRWEENELFPKVRQAKLDLIALGITLAERRDTLMDVLGLHGDDEEGAANMRDIQRPTGQRVGVARQST